MNTSTSRNLPAKARQLVLAQRFGEIVCESFGGEKHHVQRRELPPQTAVNPLQQMRLPGADRPVQKQRIEVRTRRFAHLERRSQRQAIAGAFDKVGQRRETAAHFAPAARCRFDAGRGCFRILRRLPFDGNAAD